MTTGKNRRKSKRIKIDNLSKLNDVNCSVINISKDGLLLTANVRTNSRHVDLQLKVNGKWIDVHGEIMWMFRHRDSKLVSMGLFIKDAPQEYREFVDNLYLEAEEQRT